MNGGVGDKNKMWDAMLQIKLRMKFYAGFSGAKSSPPKGARAKVNRGAVQFKYIGVNTGITGGCLLV